MTRGIPISEEACPRRGSRSALFRQVSQEFLGSEDDITALKFSSKDGRGSPARCVSDYDRVTEASLDLGSNDAEESSISSCCVPAFRTPLDCSGLYQHHASATRLEAELLPFRAIISRVMSHTTLNRKGIFNVPVDHVALRLPDYLSVVKKPMDLGSVRTRLHAMEYDSREAVVYDVRLVFKNAMTYNPPMNAVHVAAKELLAFFEEQLVAFVPDFQDDYSCSASADQVANAEAGISTSGAPCTPCNLSTRNSTCFETLFPSSIMDSKKRKKRGSKKNVTHACQWCEGRKCAVCNQGCMSLEPCLLICNGAQCSGSRIRKGATYFIAPDGSRQYCERCYIGLPAVLPNGASDHACRYKRELLKRKNDEEVVEGWVSCTKCKCAVHKVCAMFNDYLQDDTSFVCGECSIPNQKPSPFSKKHVTFAGNNLYSYVSGAANPVPLEDLIGGRGSENLWTSDSLPECSVSSFIQEKIQEKLRSSDQPHADKTVTVRVISDCDKHFKVPDVVRNHFRSATSQNRDEEAQPPSHVLYRSKAIAMFQKIDGFDVCIFCMYVQEYNGSDKFEDGDSLRACTDSKRVYIAYLDSVEHFRPRRLRTTVYHEILVAYLATAKARGFEAAHIWACPPSRGNSFVFWTYPSSQRTPTQERLTTWYHEALLRALSEGIVTDVKSLYETDFEPLSAENEENEGKSDNACPPLLDGDFWIEEAVRLHAINMSRHLKSRTTDGRIVATASDRIENEARNPALEAATFIRDQVIADPVSFFFRKPVNAAALNLKDYHKIIPHPMDLGTMYARCMLGEYATLKAMVDDLELIVSNAKKFNPSGHIVHVKAEELRELFFAKLNELVRSWPDDLPFSDWTSAQKVNLRLGASFVSDNSSVASVVSSSVLSADTNQDADPTIIDLLSGGVGALEKRMVGRDSWLLEKKTSSAANTNGSQKKAQNRRRKSVGSVEGEPACKRRRQTWLAEEVSSSIRKLRQSFFSCSLQTDGAAPVEQDEKFVAYASSFKAATASLPNRNPTNLADARHSLLEFSQSRNLQFDTLRRAKYSTAVLLYHLHNSAAPGVVPCCSGCGENIKEVRWHKICKVTEIRRDHVTVHSVRRTSEPSVFVPEELCPTCFSSRVDQMEFIPIQVTCTPTH